MRLLIELGLVNAISIAAVVFYATYLRGIIPPICMAPAGMFIGYLVARIGDLIF